MLKKKKKKEAEEEETEQNSPDAAMRVSTDVASRRQIAHLPGSCRELGLAQRANRIVEVVAGCW